MGRGRHELPREVYGTAGESRGRCLRRWSRGWLPGRAAQGRSSTHVLEAVSVGPLMSHDNDQRKGAPSGPPARPSGSGRHWTPTEGPQVPGHAAASPAPSQSPVLRCGQVGPVKVCRLMVCLIPIGALEPVGARAPRRVFQDNEVTWYRTHSKKPYGSTKSSGQCGRIRGHVPSQTGTAS